MKRVRNIPLGAFIHLAGIITAEDLRYILRSLLNETRCLGEVLVSLGLVSQDLLDKALILQCMMRLDAISAAHGVLTLRYIHLNGVELDVALKEAEKECVQEIEYLS